MFSVLHGVFAVLHLGFAVWAFRLYQKKAHWAIFFLIAVAVGLAYDNAVVASGVILGVGDNLSALSLPRFAIHAFLTPTMLFVGLFIAREAGIIWAQSSNAISITSVAVLALIALGTWQGLLGIDLQPACHNGTLRYAERITESQLCENVTYPDDILERRGMPPLASIITIVCLAVIGGFIWRKTGWMWLCLAAIAMFITAAIPTSAVGLWLGNGGEVLLVLGMLLSLRYVQQPNLVTA